MTLLIFLLLTDYHNGNSTHLCGNVDWCVLNLKEALFFLHSFFFFCSRSSFSRPSLLPLLFHTPLELVLSKGNLVFIMLCGGMQVRKEEGKTMISMATRVKQPTQSCYYSCLKPSQWVELRSLFLRREIFIEMCP